MRMVIKGGRMRKIGIYTDGVFRQKDYERGFELIKRCGFDCADYSGLLDPGSEFGLLNGSELEMQMKAVRRAADNAGVEIYQMHGPWTAPLPNLTEEERRVWTDYAKKCITVSAVLGSPHYVVHPIMPFGVRGKEDPDVVYDCNRRFLTEICECADRVGVTVCYENMPFPWMTIYSAQHIFAIVKELGLPNLKVCLDTGHELVGGVQPAEAVRSLGSAIEAMHVHDNYGDSDRHILPGQGKADWKAFSLAVDECIPESVPLILETGPSHIYPDEVRESLLRGYAGVAKYLCETENLK